MSHESIKGPVNATALVAMAAVVCAVVQVLGNTPAAAAHGMTLTHRTLESPRSQSVRPNDGCGQPERTLP